MNESFAATTLSDATRLGALDRAGLAGALRPLWEDAGPLVDQLLGRRATSWDEHLAAAEAEIAAMDAAAQAQLLQAHPRIGADPATLSAASFREQAGSSPTDPDTLARLERLNQAYEDRFGFPFVEFVAGRSKETIAAVLELRLTRPVDVERRAGCEALVAIARDRLGKLRSEVL
jgi:2-oxo-4-hydroxy-4-carboxy--5-ureidoimidazoline (OHCU) decarboxylase